MPATIGAELFIGEQVAYWRKRRGKTQRALAGLAGLSQPYLSQIERGERPVDRRATLVALAGALSLSVSELTGQPGDPTAPAKATAAASVPAIREALIRREVGEIRPPTGSVEKLLEAGGAYDFATAAPMLPALLGGLTGPELIQVCHVAVFTLKHLGYPDLPCAAPPRLSDWNTNSLDCRTQSSSVASHLPSVTARCHDPATRAIRLDSPLSTVPDGATAGRARRRPA